MNASSNYTKSRVRVGTVPFDVETLQGATEKIIELAEQRQGIPVRLANSYCVAIAAQDPSYSDLLNGRGLNYPDGVPVAWYMRTLDQDAGVVRGPSLFTGVLDKSQASGVTHFFLGATEETLQMLLLEVGTRFPSAKIVGTYAPPFGPLDDAFYRECMAQIEASQPNLVWVAIGSPKQDFAAARLANMSGVPCVGVGAAFDFVAGTVREAPSWLRESGFEWLYRFAREPRRLWRRYIIGNVNFCRAVLAGRKKHAGRR